jgi:hypothetical protein
MMITNAQQNFQAAVVYSEGKPMGPAYIDDALLDALGDRWPFIEPDFPGQTFEAWLFVRLRDYNKFGYPRHLNVYLSPPTLWDLVDDLPPANFSDYVARKAEELRATGGTLVQRVRDLTPLAALTLLV